MVMIRMGIKVEITSSSSRRREGEEGGGGGVREGGEGRKENGKMKDRHYLPKRPS